MRECTRHTYRQTTSWGAYVPTSDGMMQARKIQTRTCATCGHVQENMSSATRATRERALILARELPRLSQTAERVALLRRLLESAEPDGEGLATTRGMFRAVRRPLTQTDFEQALATLAEAGLVTLERRFDPAGQHELLSIRWDPAQYDALSTALGIEREPDPLATIPHELKEAIEKFEVTAGLQSFTDLWQDQLAQLDQGAAELQDERGETLASSRSPSRYARLLRATIGIASCAATGELVGLRMLSSRITTDAKALDAEAETLERLLDAPLESFGVLVHDELVRVAGPLSVEHANGFLARPGAAFAGIPGALVASSTWKTTASRVIVAENLTTFEHLVRAPEHAADAKVWSAGRPSRARRAAVERLISAGARTVLAWADMDPSGLEIAEEMRQLAAKTGGTWQPHRMSVEEFDAVATRRPLLSRARKRAEVLREAGQWYSPIAARMIDTNSWVEQEIQ